MWKDAAVGVRTGSLVRRSASAVRSRRLLRTLCRANSAVVMSCSVGSPSLHNRIFST
jgi:hypothetical protein